MFTQGIEPAPERPSNVAKRTELTLGDVERGFAEADVIVENSFIGSGGQSGSCLNSTLSRIKNFATQTHPKATKFVPMSTGVMSL